MDSRLTDGLDAALGPPPGAPLETVDAVDLLAEPYTRPEFLIEHLAQRRGVALWSADSGAGKTALLIHAAVAIATRTPVANRFAVDPEARSVLFVNGEMGRSDVKRYLDSAVAGVGQSVPRGRFFFEGVDAFASFQLGAEAQAGLEATLAALNPSLVIFDTSRAVFSAMDENSAREVGDVFAWLRRLAETYDLSVIVAHHRRKLSQVSNSDRERVAGSNALIGAPDIHLVLRSQSGRTVHELYLDKTRSAVDDVRKGTTWPVDARLEQDPDGGAPCSVFIVGPPNAGTTAEPVAAVSDGILERLQADGPLTVHDLGAAGGSKKRALEQLQRDGTIVKVGKVGRSYLLGIAGLHENMPLTNLVTP